MKYVLPIISGVLFLGSISPWIMMFIDFYYWFFFDVTLSNINWFGDSPARALGIFLTFVPAIIFGAVFMAAMEDLEYKK